MAEPTLTPPLHEPPPPDAAHQEKDFPVGAVLKFAAWFVGAVVVVHLLVLLYLVALAGLFPKTQLGPESQISRKDQVPLPRSGDDLARPKMQVSDVADLKKLNDEENQKLTGYRWVNEMEGIVQIPIERA